VTRRLSVAVVQGGPSSEAEVSRVSARAVTEALAAGGHSAVRLELDGHLAESIRTGAFDVVFPMAHGAVGEDGALQGLLEVLGVPFVGSGVLASALAMNKRFARRILESSGLPIARGTSVGRGEDVRAAAERARREIGAALVVKPASHGSAIGVSRHDSAAPIEAVARGIEQALALDEFAIVEHFARGREVTCGVLERDGEPAPLALPPTEISSPRDAFYTYEARYAPGRSVHRCPAELDAAVAGKVKDVALRAHVALGCRDLSRVDMIVGDDGDGDRVTLLEVNTLPGFTTTSLYPEAAVVHGLSMVELCAGLARRAFARGPTLRTKPLPLPT
jgi:D-alanine-D-alanine ligase